MRIAALGDRLSLPDLRRLPGLWRPGAKRIRRTSSGAATWVSSVGLRLQRRPDIGYGYGGRDMAFSHGGHVA